MTTKQYDAYSDLITFTRASTGTALRRVGYSPELVTNGTFDTDTDWTKSGTTTISGGQATLASAFAYIEQSLAVSNRDVVRVSYEVVSNTDVGGNLALSNSGFTNATIFITDTVGTHTLDVVVNDATKPLKLIIAKASTVVLDNVSVKEVIFDRATDSLVLFNHPTNVPRIEYDADGNRRGLLIEEARTNLVPASNDWGNGTYWSTIRATFTANQAVSPDGSVNADALTEDTTASSTHLGLSSSNITVVDAAIYTSSIFVKANTRSWVQLQEGQGVTASAYFNLLTGEIGTVSGTGSPSASIQDVGNGWYRCSLTFTSLGTAARIRLYLATGNGGATYTGDGTSGVFLWGAQLEAGSFPTSYISTSGAAASRSADVASIPTSAFGYNADKGTVVVDCSIDRVASVAGISIAGLFGSAFDISNSTRVFYRSNGTTGYQNTDGGVTSVDLSPPGVLTAGQNINIAFAYVENDFAVVRNGGTVQTDTSGSLPEHTLLQIGSGQALLNGHIKSIQYYPRRLTNTQLQELTS